MEELLKHPVLLWACGALIIASILGVGFGMRRSAGAADERVPPLTAPTAVPGVAGMTGPPAPGDLGIGAIPQGVPAIRPESAPVGPTGASFTAADVVAHIANCPVVGTGKLGVRGPLTVEQIEFLPSREVRERLSFETSMPGDTLLCLATLRGAFTVSGPLGATPSNYTKAFRVYHAHTGNFLGQGTRE